jgi:hypothetical protein
MSGRIPFVYGEFHDVPRQIRFHFDGKWYFLRSYFVEERDDYDDAYDVYLLPHRTAAEIEADPLYWMTLSNAMHLGRIPITELRLDQTRRQTLDGHTIGAWLSSLR